MKESTKQEYKFYFDSSFFFKSKLPSDTVNIGLCASLHRQIQNKICLEKIRKKMQDQKEKRKKNGKTRSLPRAVSWQWFSLYIDYCSPLCHKVPTSEFVFIPFSAAIQLVRTGFSFPFSFFSSITTTAQLLFASDEWDLSQPSIKD